MRRRSRARAVARDAEEKDGVTWYVRIGGRIVGWVIAADREEALRHAVVKFPSWDMEACEVEPRRRRRKAA